MRCDSLTVSSPPSLSLSLSPISPFCSHTRSHQFPCDWFLPRPWNLPSIPTASSLQTHSDTSSSCRIIVVSPYPSASSLPCLLFDPHCLALDTQALFVCVVVTYRWFCTTFMFCLLSLSPWGCICVVVDLSSCLFIHLWRRFVASLFICTLCFLALSFNKLPQTKRATTLGVPLHKNFTY